MNFCSSTSLLQSLVFNCEKSNAKFRQCDPPNQHEQLHLVEGKKSGLAKMAFLQFFPNLCTHITFFPLLHTSMSSAIISSRNPQGREKQNASQNVGGRIEKETRVKETRSWKPQL